MSVSGSQDRCANLCAPQAKPTHINIIRLAPPLVITEAQIRSAVNIVGDAIEELRGMDSGSLEEKVVPKCERGVKIGVEN